MATLSPESLRVFRKMITSTLDNWHSFQAAVDAGMGGPQTADKLSWIVESVEELFTINNQNLIPSDVEDFLMEILDNEFNTVIEDGSLEMVCANLCSSFHQICSGNLDLVNQRIEALELKTQEAKKKREETRKNHDHDDDDDEEMEVEESSSSVEKKPEKEEEEEAEEEGWTKVRNTRRH